MSVELEITVKVRMDDGGPPPQIDQPAAIPVLARLVNKLTAHPCVVMLLREVMRDR